MGVKVYSSGKHALGICDGCGGTFKLLALKDERVKRQLQKVLKCDDCRDPDHPQNFFGEKVVVDGEALRDPRPDTTVDDSREITGSVVYPPINGAEYL